FKPLPCGRSRHEFGYKRMRGGGCNGIDSPDSAAKTIPHETDDRSASLATRSRRTGPRHSGDSAAMNAAAAEAFGIHIAVAPEAQSERAIAHIDMTLRRFRW